MKFYYMPPAANYLATTAQFILKTFPDLSDTLIIVEDNFNITELQNKFIERSNLTSCILPQILSVKQAYSLIDSNKEFNLNSLQRQIKMADIIVSYDEQRFSLPYAIGLSAQLITLYDQIIINEASIDKIKEWVEQDLAEHWWDTAEFLEYVFKNYESWFREERGDNNNKIIIKNDNIIFVGLLFNSIELKSLFEIYNNAHYILPTMLMRDYQQIKEKDFNNETLSYAFYLFNYYFPSRNLDLVELNYNLNFRLKAPSYLEFDDIFIEAEYIAKTIIENNNNSNKIGVVIPDNLLGNLVQSILSEEGEDFSSSQQRKYSCSAIINLLIRLAEFKKENGSLKSFIHLLRSPLFNSNIDIQNLFRLLTEKGNLNFEDFTEISILYNVIENKSSYITKIFNDLSDWLTNSSEDFRELLETNIAILEKLYPVIWQEGAEDLEEIKRILHELLTSVNINRSIDKETYLEIIKSIFSRRYQISSSRNSKINFITSKEALLQNFNLLIIGDFNQDSWLITEEIDPWLGDKIRRKLNILNEKLSYEQAKYTILRSLYNDKVILTRSKIKSGVEIQPSPFLEYIRNVVNQRAVKIPCNQFINGSSTTNSITINQNLLPVKLYATHIELLIRNPYGFFARQILGLKKEKDILQEPSVAEFGVVAHKIINLHSLNPEQDIMGIMAMQLQELKLAKEVRNLWNNALGNLLRAYTYYDKTIRREGFKILSEITGKKVINIAGKDLIIKAIADRIEINNESKKIRIIDFKTGAVPTRKAVQNGMSPQLIIEALILVANGFFPLTFEVQNLELVYIKLNSTTPYLEEQIIHINKHELQDHLGGLTKLLEYYYKQEIFDFTELPDFWQPMYDDYCFLKNFK